MMKVYISGAITGTDDYMDRFGEAEESLIEHGFDVINPAAINARLPKSTTHEQYMRMSFLMLEMCDTIYMLNGWKESCGACQEFGFAYAKDMVFLFESEG